MEVPVVCFPAPAPVWTGCGGQQFVFENPEPMANKKVDRNSLIPIELRVETGGARMLVGVQWAVREIVR
jgi:hypothetical protein